MTHKEVLEEALEDSRVDFRRATRELASSQEHVVELEKILKWIADGLDEQSKKTVHKPSKLAGQIRAKLLSLREVHES